MSRCPICDQKPANCDCSDQEREQSGQIEELTATIEMLVNAAVKAYAELNTIRARDGVPYTNCGARCDVDPDYFSSVVDGLDEAVKEATGHSAYCHPSLYK